MLKKILSLLFSLQFLLLFSQKKVTNDKEASHLLGKSSQLINNYEFDESLKTIEIVLEYSLKNDKNEITADAYDQIGRNFNEVKDFTKAIEYYNKGLVYAKKSKNSKYLYYLYNDLGNVYALEKQEIKTGIYYYKLALKYVGSYKEDLNVIIIKSNLATLYFDLKEYDKGLVYLNEIKNYLKSNKDSETESWYADLIADYYSYNKQYKTAEESYLKSIELAKKKNTYYIKTQVVETHLKMYKMFLANGNQTKALFHLMQHDKLEDDLFIEERKNSIYTSGTSLQIKESKLIIEKIEAEKKIQEKNLSNAKTLNIVSVIFVLILLLSFGFLYKSLLANKKTNEKLILAKEKAEEATILKSKFISTITHELRTPLYGVIGVSEILEKEHVELKDSKYLKSLQFSANYLLHLVNDVLRLSKMEESKIELDFVTIDLKKDISVLMNSMELLAIKNNNKLELIINDNVPKYVVTDSVRLSQILINLISNSIKFTNNGNVILKIEADKIETNNCLLTFKVIDNGIGIPKEFLNSVFDKFVQLDKKDETYQGTGLGLSIVKKLISLLDGTILLESEENVGTTITIQLPVKKVEFISNEMEQIDIKRLQGLKFMVVDDNKINQLVTEKLLLGLKIKPTMVSNGFDAIEIVKNETFDIILMDINMPIINGFETSEKIREFNKTTPIIALTASEKSELTNKISQYGINDILIKPFETNELVKISEKYIA